ncbi:MAG: replication protein RepA [Janthinobacterium lividum]
MDDDTPAQGDLLRPLPPTTARVIRFSAEIAEAQPERPDYLHSVLCQVGLPRSRTQGTKFKRTNGNASLLVEAGSLWDGTDWIEQPLPYGTRPRLALVYVSSEAVRTKSPTVELGNSVRDFLVRLGVDTGGREYATFNKQMRALAACRMTLGFGAATIDAKPIKQFTAWTDAATGSKALTPGTIELSPEFFTSLAEAAVPLDARALSALQHSSLALDTYCWLAHRLHRVRRITGERLSWKNLREQFGQEYADPKNFKREMEKALRTVLAVYRDARIEQVDGGLILLPSPPPVPKTLVQVRDRQG